MNKIVSARKAISRIKDRGGHVDVVIFGALQVAENGEAKIVRRCDCPIAAKQAVGTLHH